MKDGKRQYWFWWGLGGIAFIYIASLCFLPRDGFWAVDNVNKFLQMRAAIDSGYRSVAIPWPGQSLDPEFRFNPLEKPFSVVANGQLHSIFPPPFALLCTVPYRLFGPIGLSALSLVSSLLMLCGVYRLAGVLRLGSLARVAAMLVSGLCTPVWFYSVVFWEHASALCLCVWAVVFVLEYCETGELQRLGFGAASVAAAIYLRDELYLFAGLLLVAVLWQQTERRSLALLTYAGVAMICLIPLWLLNRYYTGSPFGHHLGEHWISSGSLWTYLQDRTIVIERQLARLHQVRWISWLLASPFLLLAIRPLKLVPDRLPTALAWAGLVGLASFSFTAGCYLGFTSHEYSLYHNGLFAGMPLLILAFVGPQNGSGQRMRQLVWALVVGYALSYSLLAPKLGSAGVHWGNRYLLVLYPLLSVLCVGNVAQGFRILQRKTEWRALVVGLVLAATFAAQLHSIFLLRETLNASQRLNACIAALPDPVIITPVWYLPQMLPEVFYQKPIYLVSKKRPQDWQVLTARLRARGVKEALVLLLNTEVVKIPKGGQDVTLTDEGVRFYHLRLVRLPLGSDLGPEM